MSCQPARRCGETDGESEEKWNVWRGIARWEEVKEGEQEVERERERGRYGGLKQFHEEIIKPRL